MNNKRIFTILLFIVFLFLIQNIVFATEVLETFPPTINTESFVISNTNVTIGDTVKIAFEVTDETKVETVRLYYTKPETGDNTSEIFLTYNDVTKLYEADLVIDSNWQNGEYKIKNIFVSDGKNTAEYKNNKNSYNVYSPEAISLDLSCLNFTVYGINAADITPPEIKPETLHMSDNKGIIGDNISILIEVLDDNSVKEVNVVLQNGDNNYRTLKMYTSSPGSTYFVGNLIFDNEMANGPWYIKSVYAIDENNNYSEIINSKYGNYANSYDWTSKFIYYNKDYVPITNEEIIKIIRGRLNKFAFDFDKIYDSDYMFSKIENYINQFINDNSVKITITNYEGGGNFTFMEWSADINIYRDNELSETIHLGWDDNTQIITLGLITIPYSCENSVEAHRKYVENLIKYKYNWNLEFSVNCRWYQEPIVLMDTQKFGTKEISMLFYGFNYIENETVFSEDLAILQENETNATPIKDINELEIESIGDFTYTGEEIKPKLNIKNCDYNLIENLDYTLEYVNNINEGEATIIIKGLYNYKGNKEIKFKIEKPKGKIEYTCEDKEVIYNGYEHTIDINVTTPINAIIKYADKNGNYTLTEAPLYANPGTYIIKYKIISQNYETVIGESTLNIKTIIDENSFKVSKTEATIGDSITITCKLNKEGNIDRYIALYFIRPQRENDESIYLYYNSTTKLYETTINITNNWENGIYYLRTVYFPNLTHPFYYNNKIPNHYNYNNKNPDQIDLSSATFTIYGTNADIEYPAIRPETLTVSNKKGAVGDIINYFIKITDNVKVSRAKLWLESEHGEFEIINMTYNDENDLWNAKFKITNKTSTVKWYVYKIEATDSNNNGTYIYSKKYNYMGNIYDWSSQTICNYGNYTNPVMTENSLSINTNAITYGEKIDISLEAMDEFGIESVKVYYNQENPEEKHIVDLPFLKVNKTEGELGFEKYFNEYKGTISFDKYGYNGIWKIEKIEILSIKGITTTIYNKEFSNDENAIDLSVGDFETYGLIEKYKIIETIKNIPRNFVFDLEKIYNYDSEYMFQEIEKYINEIVNDDSVKITVTNYEGGGNFTFMEWCADINIYINDELADIIHFGWDDNTQIITFGLITIPCNCEDTQEAYIKYAQNAIKYKYNWNYDFRIESSYLENMILLDTKEFGTEQIYSTLYRFIENGDDFGEPLLLLKEAEYNFDLIKDINELEIENIEDYIYTGKEIKPIVKIKDEEYSLIKDFDYTLEYLNNINSGKATIIIKGINNYKGTKEIKFNIIKTIESISLNTENVIMNPNQWYYLIATIDPFDAIYTKPLEWSSSNPNIVFVDNIGRIYAYSEGEAVITVITENGKTATCTVIVEPAEPPTVVYRTHVQDYGWQNYVINGEMSGTEGEAKRLEGIIIALEGQKYAIGIEYRTHVQDYGWQDYVKNGQMSGTEGEAKRLEAIQIRLTDGLEKYFDVYYRVHCQMIGWMNWAKNGEMAGSAGYAYRLEGIEIVVVKKGENPPQRDNINYDKAFKENLISYTTHVQDYGWQDYVKNGEMSGTEGECKRLEGIIIALESQKYSGGIEYRTHVQDYGWQDYVSNACFSGTTGEAKRLEAIQIKLTGEMAEHYDIYYRVHCQNIGWMNWAKNGEMSGSAGYAYRLEGIEIVLVEKGVNPPDIQIDTNESFIMTEN